MNENIKIVFLCMSSKVDRFMSSQDQNDQRPILHIVRHISPVKMLHLCDNWSSVITREGCVSQQTRGRVPTCINYCCVCCCYRQQRIEQERRDHELALRLAQEDQSQVEEMPGRLVQFVCCHVFPACTNMNGTV